MSGIVIPRPAAGGLARGPEAGGAGGSAATGAASAPAGSAVAGRGSAPRVSDIKPPATGQMVRNVAAQPITAPPATPTASAVPTVPLSPAASMPPPANPQSLSTSTSDQTPNHQGWFARLIHHRRGRQAVVAACTLGFVAITMQLSLGAAFAGRFLPGVTVANVGIGGLTRPEAQARLQAQVQGYRFKLAAGGTTYQLTPAEAGVSYNLQATLDQAYQVGRPHSLTPHSLTLRALMPLALAQAAGSHGHLGYSLSTNSAVQQAFVQQVAAASGQQPVDATVVVQNGVPTAQPDKNGRGLSPTALAADIDSTVANLGSNAPALQPSVLVARIRTANLTSAIDQTKQLLATPVTITYQGKSFQPTAAQMGAWILYNKSPPSQAPGLTPKVDPAAVAAYLASVAKQINVTPVTEKVNVQNGVSSVFQQGQNGLALDTATLASTIAAAVSAKQPLTTAAPTVAVPFQTQYNNSVPLPYDKYIEINLSQQHLWVYQDHQVVYDSPITSGATGAGFPTVTGLFSILSKQTDRHLVGYQYGPAYNYDVFVQYWMQFYEGFGLHDASWRNGKFGGPDYYYDGSHGCVNLPLATAAFLYGWTDIGTPVWVHN